MTIFSLSRLTGGTNRRLIASYNGNSNWLLGYHGNLVDRAYFEGWVHSAGPAADTNAHMYEAVIRGPGQNSDFYVFDNRDLTGAQLLASNTGGTTGPNGFALGAWKSNLSESSNGDVGEVLIFRGLLSAARCCWRRR